MVAIEESVSYPTENDDWLKIILIGGVLSLLSFLVIPVILVYGYIIRLIRARFDDRAEPPEFDDWETLLTDGVRAMIILVAYFLIPAIVGAITIGGSVLAIATGTRGGAAAGIGGLLIGGLLTFALGLVFGYVAVAALLNFAREDSIGAGFDFGALRPILVDGDYAVAWLAAVAVFFVTSFITGVVNGVPFIGAVITAFVFFYAQMVAAYLWADGFTDAVGGAARSGAAIQSGPTNRP
jgi:hypothetical protein